MPQVLSQMVNVEDLRLGRNQIASLMSNQTMKMTLADGREKEVVVESFKQLVNLESFSLAVNRLTTLPVRPTA